jgi:hypothetical protein
MANQEQQAMEECNFLIKYSRTLVRKIKKNTLKITRIFIILLISSLGRIKYV